MAKRRIKRISLPILLLLAYIVVGFVSGVLTGETDLVLWITEHKLLLAIILTWTFVRFIRK